MARPRSRTQAALVDLGEVVGAQPSIGGERRRRARRVAPVAGHHRRRPELEPRGGGVDPYLDTWPGPADGVQRLVVVGIEGGARADPAGLGRRIPDRVRRAESPPSLLDERGRRRPTTDHDRAHRREVELGERRLPEEQPDLGGHPADRGHLLGGDDAQCIGRPPALEQVDARASPQVPGQLGGEPDVGELRRGEHGPTSTPRARGLAEVDVGDGVQLPLPELGALGLAGGAGGEDDKTGALGVRRWHRGRGEARPCRGVLGDLPVLEHEIGTQLVQHDRPFGSGEPGVDARRHRAELREGDDGQHPVDIGSVHQTDDAAFTDAFRREGGGHGVTAAMQLGVRDGRTSVGHQRRAVAEAVGRSGHDAAEHRHRLRVRDRG